MTLEQLPNFVVLLWQDLGDILTFNAGEKEPS